jgi:hypothetical protein
MTHRVDSLSTNQHSRRISETQRESEMKNHTQRAVSSPSQVHVRDKSPLIINQNEESFNQGRFNDKLKNLKVTLTNIRSNLNSC